MKFIAFPASVALVLIALTANAQAVTPASANADSPMPTLAPMIKKVGPTVVGISTKGTVKQSPNPLMEDPFFRRFFGDRPEFNAPRERPFTSLGSGVVIDAANGYIITNAHVIENAKEITITAQDDHEYKAELVGADEHSDVAVLKLKQGKLPAIALGDSGKLEVGDFVVAIGNPFGLQHTVTSGIVSAVGRTNINPGINRENFEDFIQTDASINPGNSGGALVNLRGELVGINSAILSGGGGNIGIGFAIPVNMVKNVMADLIKYGEVKRGLLGVKMYTLTPDLLQAVGAPADTQGALVSEVVAGSAADKAGIKIKDIITSINGENVKGAAELKRAIGMLRVGDKVDVGLIRDGKPRKVTALITEASKSELASATEIHEALEGARLVDAEDGGGVLVQAVEAGSPASQSGLRTNDVIVGVNRARIADLQGLQDATKGLEEGASGGATFVLTIRRGNATLLLPIR
jgi:serine protease Do/serine protease DegQ